MQLAIQPLDDLAVALEYPGAGTAGAARAAAALAATPALRDALLRLAETIDGAGPGQAEEGYTRLFDLKPVCTLHAGYHLFGETYVRGGLLAGLAGELKARGIAYEHDLPDYVPTLLRLLGRLSDDEERRLLVHALLVPSLEKMAPALAEAGGPYGALLAALTAELAASIDRGDVVPLALETKGEAAGRLPVLQQEVLPCSI